MIHEFPLLHSSIGVQCSTLVYRSKRPVYRQAGKKRKARKWRLGSRLLPLGSQLLPNQIQHSPPYFSRFSDFNRPEIGAHG